MFQRAPNSKAIGAIQTQTVNGIRNNSLTAIPALTVGRGTGIARMAIATDTEHRIAHCKDDIKTCRKILELVCSQVRTETLALAAKTDKIAVA